MLKARPSVLVLGAGKIGCVVGHLLAKTGDYEVRVADTDAAAVQRAANDGLSAVQLEGPDGFRALMPWSDILVSALPHDATLEVALFAAAAGVHYFDLTEDVAAAEKIANAARNAGAVAMPQCGLAPGAITLLAQSVAARFDHVRELTLRVGALPRYPMNKFGWANTWSARGLVNECLMPCRAILNGQPVSLPPMAELETFTLDGTPYECFTTSGGLGTLWETYAGKIDKMIYKTIRYPGHRDVFKILADDFGLAGKRDTFVKLIEDAMPATSEDVIVIVVTGRGMRNGRFMEESLVRRIPNQEFLGRPLTAIQVTTAAGVCAMVDLLREGVLPQKGFVRQEQVPYQAFIANRFGRVYA